MMNGYQNWCAKYAGYRSFDFQKGGGECFLHKVVSSDSGIEVRKEAGAFGGNCAQVLMLTYLIVVNYNVNKVIKEWLVMQIVT